MEEKLYKCPFCGELIKKGNAWHIKKCIEKYVSELSQNQKDTIIKKYIEEEYSMVDMSKYMKLPYRITEKILNHLGLRRRTIKESKSKERCKEKYKETCLKHFGQPHNFCKESASRKEWEKRLLEEEGITNVFQRKDVIDKIKKTMNDRYTSEEQYYNRIKGSTLDYWVEKLGYEEGKKRYEEICYNKGKCNTYEYYVELYGEKAKEKYKEKFKQFFKGKHFDGLNKKCENILKKYNIEYTREYLLLKEDKIHYYAYDFKIHNLLLELNGLYWHCSPKKYKANDLVKFPNGHYILAKDKWDYDEAKKNYALNQKYKYAMIWEDEFSEDKLINILKENDLWKN